MNKPIERIIIGETELGGLPISAPVSEEAQPHRSPTSLRWKKRADGSFALEQMGRSIHADSRCNVWLEIACVLEEKK